MSVREADEALIEEVCSRVRELTEDGSADAEAFVRQFYRWISPEDIAERDPLDLYGLAVGLLGFARRARPRRDQAAGVHPAVRDSRLAEHAHRR